MIGATVGTGIAGFRGLVDTIRSASRLDEAFLVESVDVHHDWNASGERLGEEWADPGRSDIEIVQLGLCEPSELEGEFVRGVCQFGALEEHCVCQVLWKLHLEIQADLVVGGSSGGIRRLIEGVVLEEVLNHPQQTTHIHFGADFFEHFSSQRLRRRLTHFDPAAWQRPEVVVLAPMEQNPILMNGDAGHPTQEDRLPIPQLRLTHLVPSIVGQEVRWWTAEVLARVPRDSGDRGNSEVPFSLTPLEHSFFAQNR